MQSSSQFIAINIPTFIGLIPFLLPNHCVLEETTRTTADDLDEDGAERPRLPRAVMDRRSRPGPEPTTLEAVGDQWRYALVVVQAREEEKEEEEPTMSEH